MLFPRKCATLFFFTFTLKITKGKKVLEINKKPLNETIDIPNSNIGGFSDITICGKFLTHQFSSRPQKIFQIETEMGFFGLGTIAGYDCDEVYRGYL